MWQSFIVLAAMALSFLARSSRAEPRPGLLTPCRLPGSESEVLCGVIKRPLRPIQEAAEAAADKASGSQPATQIDIHFAVLPAIARNKKPDPVFFFAGGPGQAATRLLGPIGTLFKRLQNRRDIVFIDQRGTGRSAPLYCPEISPAAPLREQLLSSRWDSYLAGCLAELQKLPHGDLRYYSTHVAMADADAVRQALGVTQVNLIGGSYGTRAALEYLRQFPAQVRRAVIDGVAPPDMRLPESLETDAYAAFSTWLYACAADADCQRRHPSLQKQWTTLVASLPQQITVTHPHTGVSERITLSREDLLGLLRGPLYAPSLAAALPLALAQASQGRFEPLFGLSAALAGGDSMRLALGMHFSVVCAEDLPPPASPAAAIPPPTAGLADREFADSYRRQYHEVCAKWPRGVVPAAFHSLPATPAPTLVLSGGLDPVTPPRHGERVAKALGEKARHIVVQNAGHGVLPLPCMPDVVHRFVDAPTDGEALSLDASCAIAIPRPLLYRGIAAAEATAASPAPSPQNPPAENPSSEVRR